METRPHLFVIDAREVVINGVADVIALRDQLEEEAKELPKNYIPIFRINSKAPDGA